jgi:hypothetical protein
MRPSIRFVAAVMLALLILVIPAIAAPANTITVCPLGCDYAALQPAIDAATPGDTILIGSGTYTGQLVLKSDLTLRAQAGPTHTIVTASASPIVSGSNLVSVTLEGLGITGSDSVTELIGIDLQDSSVLLSNTLISELHGASGTLVYTRGATAIGLRVSGTLSVTLFNSVIENISGGDALPDSEERGGDAIGVQADGTGQLTIVSSMVRNLVGGAAGSGSQFMYCIGAGGRSLGIKKEGSANLSVEYTLIENLTGGFPCESHIGPTCRGNAGEATGIYAEGGLLLIQASRLNNYRVWESSSSARATGVIASNTRNVTINLTSLSTFTAADSLSARSGPNSPSCYWGRSSAAAIVLDADDQAVLENNQLTNLFGIGWGGEARGISTYNTVYITATSNQIENLSGGSAWTSDETGATVNGISIDAAAHVILSANQISNLHGGAGEITAYNFNSQGGAAVAIRIKSAAQANISNNIIHSIQGGNGANNTYPGGISDSQAGGNASGLLLSDSSSWVQNNTVYDVRGGEHGYPQGIAGQGTGIKLINLLNALVINNAFISTTVGVSATASNYIWDYNALWHNTLNYSGVVTGPHDIFADPWFADSAVGDFHLSFSSPLIDAGFNLGAPLHDFAGTPRPLEGNNDGIARTDVGAYEYQYVPLNFVYLPIIRSSQP